MADISPSTMASQLATAYTSATQSLITTQTKSAQTTSTALTKLQSALSAFETALTALSGKKGVVEQSATLSNTTLGTATASAKAQPGTYSVFVEKVATFHQIAFEDLPAVPVSLGGPLVVQLGDGSSFNVDLSAADQDSNGTISQAEIARAINMAQDNKGKVTAMTVTSGGTTQLVLSSGVSGEAGKITLDASGVPAGALKDALSDPGNELSAAQDAVLWLGAQGSGLRIQQGSNTFTAIDGVSLTVTQAMATGAAPATLTVASDKSGTANNLQSFVSAYNTLESTLDDLTTYGKDGAASAALASDPGVRALRNRLSSALRQQVGGVSLADFGIKSSRDGSISLDTAKLDKGLAAHPDGLDALIGSNSLSAPSGVLGAFQAASKTWTDSSHGQLKQRQDSLQAAQKRLATRQTRLDDQYTNAYNRYLAQFTRLQALQSQMSDTTSMLSNLSTS